MLAYSRCCHTAFRQKAICQCSHSLLGQFRRLERNVMFTSTFAMTQLTSMTNIFISSLASPVRLCHTNASNNEQQQEQQFDQKVQSGEEHQVKREEEVFDVVIVGAGPAGLAAAIRLKQLVGNAKDQFRVGVVQKGSEVGAHILSGACFEPHSLDELLPQWRSTATFDKTDVTQDQFYILRDSKRAVQVPWIPPALHNRGNIIISLGSLTKWLSQQAEALGVQIYPGFAAAKVVLDDNEGYVKGIQLNDMGVNKQNQKTDQYEPGMIFSAAQTVFAQGCRGSCTKMLEQQFNLRAPDNIQTYGLGIKEVWQVPKAQARPGRVLHTVGWPTNDTGHCNTYGGAFMYDYGESLISCGYVVGLDYSNPYIRPYMEMQKWKTHDMIRAHLANGRPLYYGARALVEGGLSSLPTLHFPGGVLVGDTAGFLNLTKIKGTHAAMKSGILAAQAIYADAFNDGQVKQFGVNCSSYNDRFRSSWLYKQLYKVRNVRQQFHKNFYWGMCYTALTTALTQGIEPWTSRHTITDHASLRPIAESTPIEYPKTDNTLTFDLLTNLSRSGTVHNANQPCHLKLRDSSVPEKINLPKYGGPESRYCPAGVYEYVDGKLVINAQNCLHCKTCDIKDPTQNIDWAVPEGGGGPNYQGQM